MNSRINNSILKIKRGLQNCIYLFIYFTQFQSLPIFQIGTPKENLWNMKYTFSTTGGDISPRKKQQMNRKRKNKNKMCFFSLKRGHRTY